MEVVAEWLERQGQVSEVFGGKTNTARCLTGFVGLKEMEVSRKT